MQLPTILLAAFALLTTAACHGPEEPSRPCGFKIAPCPRPQICKPNDPGCSGQNCLGTCVNGPGITTLPMPLPTPPGNPKYQSCGGFRIEPKPCPQGYICIDDPYRGGCGMACDMPGICVKPQFCGGFAGFKCEGGKRCVDDPRDDCDPRNGGADCGGICV